MTEVTVTPQEFSLVDFDATLIQELVAGLAERIGLGSEISVRIDETSPLARARVASGEPLVVEVDGGAFEDPKRPRQLSRLAVVDVLGRLLLRERDRRDVGFGAPDEDGLQLARSVAWDVYSVGRLGRLGYRTQRQRWLYHFRNRCGFSDAADRAFAEIWDSEQLSWSRLCELVP